MKKEKTACSFCGKTFLAYATIQVSENAIKGLPACPDCMRREMAKNEWDKDE